jgi:hypothetical protein
MVIGITIDEVIRNVSDSLVKILRQEFPEFTFNDKIDIFNLEEELKMLNKDMLLEMMYANFIMDLFAYNKLTTKSINSDINNFINLCKERGHKIIFISKENERTIPPTMFFLANNNINIKNISFVEKDIEYWDLCDVLITTSYKTIDCKPSNDKKSIKLLTDFNINTEADFEIKRFSEIFELEIFE